MRRLRLGRRGDGLNCHLPVRGETVEGKDVNKKGFGLPCRIRLSRRKGFNLQQYSLALNGLPAVNVARPGKWGNPFKVGGYYARSFRLTLITNQKQAVDCFERLLEGGLSLQFTKVNIRRELRGKNLACWCELSESCHADPLLKLANY